MIYTVKNLSDPLAAYLKDDPIRPHIPHELRFGSNSHVFALTDDQNHIEAMVCAKFCKGVPSSEDELLVSTQDPEPDTAVFYTIWSYKPGAGKRLIIEALKKAQSDLPNVKRFVTLSPPTDMAKKFHLRNGATVFRVNTDTVNYEYIQL